MPIGRERSALRCIKLLTVHPAGSACTTGEVLIDAYLGQGSRRFGSAGFLVTRAGADALRAPGLADRFGCAAMISAPTFGA